MVYVDKGRILLGQMKMSHMFADTIDELNSMALKIGLKKEWYQVGNSGTPHYDICQSKKKMAIKLCARDIDRKKVVEIIKFWRNKCQI